MATYTLKEKILKFLIENKESPHSIREISKRLKADYKNTSQALNNINPETYSKKKQGNTCLIEFNQGNNIETLSVEEKRAKEFLSKNPKIKLIAKDINEIGYPFMIVLVFGSFAKGKNTPASDIDICIISDNKTKTSKLMEMLNLFSLKIEVQEFTIKEFVSMIEKKRNNLGHEIIKNNIILYGIENYYNLISKWTTKE